MDRRELEKRTKAFALRVIRFVSGLPKNKVTNVLGYQLLCPEPFVPGPSVLCPEDKVPKDQEPVEGLKAGTSIGASYREANRAESHNDFIHKIGIVEKEAAETQYWLELFEEPNIGDKEARRWLLKESGELVAIFTASGKTAKSRRTKGR